MTCRWNNKSTSSSSSNATHPASRLLSSRHSAGCGAAGKRTSGLKSYGSSPSLTFRSSSKSNKGKRKGVGKSSSASDDDDEAEDGDYFVDDNFTLAGGNGETPHHHRRNSLQRIHVDEELEEEEVVEGTEQQPFFNPLYKFGRNNKHNSSSGISAGGTNDSCSGSSESPPGNGSSFAFLRSQLKSGSGSELGDTGTRSNSSTSSSGNVLHRRSATGLSVDDDSQSDRSRSSLGYPPSQNSGNTSYSPSPPLTASNTPNDHIYSSLTDIHEAHQNNGGNGKGGRLDPFKLGDTTGSSDVVLVEVIRKQGKGSNGGENAESKTGSNNKTVSFYGGKCKLDKFGSVELIQKLGTTPNGPQTKLGKRHSVEKLDSSVASPNEKTAEAKAEGGPGKVQRFKESLKRFGRFGRSNTDKIVRTHSDSGFSTDEVHAGEFKRESQIKRQSEGEANELCEHPSEIIVASLKDTEQDTGITVKPAPRRKSPLEASKSSPENIYSVLKSSESDENRQSEFSSPTNCHHQRVTDQESTSSSRNEDDNNSVTNLMKQEESERKTTLLTEITTNITESDTVSPSIKRKQRQETQDNRESEDDEDVQIPHLEFDKGEENDTSSASQDESCSVVSSRAESLTYSSTSHEQDRSMPQQIVELVHQKHLIPKVDIVNSSSGEDGTTLSIDSSSSDTLICEVTPVIIRKRNFENVRGGQDENLSTGKSNIAKRAESAGGLSSNGATAPVAESNKHPVIKKISFGSVVENSNNNNYSGKRLEKTRKEEENNKVVGDELKCSAKANKEFDSEKREQDQQKQRSPSPFVAVADVTLNEPSSDTIATSGGDAGVSGAGGGSNMNSVGQTRSKIKSREIFDGPQQERQKKEFGKDDSVNGTEGPEIMGSKPEHKSFGGVDRNNGMGKHGELLLFG